MQTVRVSPKFQVVIPLAVREAMGLKAGQRVEVIRLDDRIELIPVRPMKKMRGFLPGLDSRVARDSDRA